MIKINERCSFKHCRSDVQLCVHCGKKIGKGKYAISMNNSGDSLAIKKNVWIHIHCIKPFLKSIDKVISKNTLIVAEMI